MNTGKNYWKQVLQFKTKQPSQFRCYVCILWWFSNI